MEAGLFSIGEVQVRVPHGFEEGVVFDQDPLALIVPQTTVHPALLEVDIYVEILKKKSDFIFNFKMMSGGTRVSTLAKIFYITAFSVTIRQLLVCFFTKSNEFRNLTVSL